MPSLIGLPSINHQPRCLDLANRITYEMDTSELGDPEAVSTIKRLRRFQSERMHQLRERWGDLLQTASKFDKSATFGQLSDIFRTLLGQVREMFEIGFGRKR